MGRSFFDKNDQFLDEGQPYDDCSKMLSFAKSMRPVSKFTGKMMILSVHTQDGDVSKVNGNLYDEKTYKNFTKPPKDEARIFLFGSSEDGMSICLQVEGYKPWIRAEIPDDFSDSQISQMCKNLFIQDFTVEYLKPFYGFIPDEKNPKLAKRKKYIKCVFDTFFDCNRAAKNLKNNNIQVTEASVKSGAKFMHDLGSGPSEWIEVRSFDYNISTKYSHCNIEISCSYSDILPIQNNAIPPLLILSFDGEMFSHDGTFPSCAKSDFTIQIGMSFWKYGSSDILQRVVLVVGECDEPQNAKIFRFKNSKDLIEGFRDFLVASDPDIITGWNIYGFDFMFLHEDYMNYYLPAHRRSTEYYQNLILTNAYSYLKKKEKIKQASDYFNECKTKHFSLIDMQKSILSKHLKLLNTKPKEFDLIEQEEEDSELSAEGAFQIKKYFAKSEKFENFLAYVDCVPHDILFANVPFEIKDLLLSKTCTDAQKGLYLSRIISEKSELTEKRMQSAAKGDNTYFFWKMTGRVIVDLMQIVKDDKKPDSNSLSFAAETWLENINKLDVKADEIFKIFRSQKKEDLMRVAEYCARDCDIPLLLIKKLTYIPIWIEMSRVCYTPMNEVINSGQQVKVYNLLSRSIWNEYALNVRDSGWPIEENEDADYEGATVIEPKVGFYDKCVSTLDFESLYPSIIRHFNLCPSVLLLDDFPKVETKNYKIKHVIKNHEQEVEYKFVTDVPGVLPKLLKRLLDARKSVKKMMNICTNPQEKEILNGRQNGIKVACNSVYGFCGVGHNKGLLPCKPVAAVTTLMGRSFIDTAKSIVERNYEAEVIYGDTDSVMILWKKELKISEAAELGKKAALEITEFLQKSSKDQAVNLAYEKTYKPYLLMKKKNYVGLKWTESGDSFKSSMDLKGIDAVRRDRPKLIRETSMCLLNNLMYEANIETALKSLKVILTSIANGERPIEDFILSKSLKNNYANENVPHLMAWKRMQERGDEDIPPVGSRMPFVVTVKKGSVGGKKDQIKLYERTEHPLFAKKNNLKIDTQYYLETIENPISKILQFVVSEQKLKSIFDEIYELSRFKLTRSTNLMQFLKRPRE